MYKEEVSEKFDFDDEWKINYNLYLSTDKDAVSNHENDAKIVLEVKTDNFFVITDLNDDEIYYWTVIPTAKGRTGKCLTQVSSFAINLYNTAPKKNSSGVVGFHKVKSKSGGRDAVYFQATWNDNGKMKTKKFYVTKKRTEQEAFELAVDCRKQKEKELYESWQGKQDKYLKLADKKKSSR